jgi:hypothetical protein
MKFGKVFNKHSVTDKKSANPSISLSNKGGVRINSHAMKLMGLTGGAKYSICQDAEEQDDWYIFADEVDGIALKATSVGDEVTFNCKSLTDELQSYFGYEGSIRLKISQTPVTVEGVAYWLIITVPAKELAKKQRAQKAQEAYEFAKNPRAA